jgi:hypothetical protein
MSYISNPNGIADLSKAVISLWFRVPKESMGADKVLLLTFGKVQQETELIPNWENVCSTPGSGDPHDPGPFVPGVTSYSSGGNTDLDPCSIFLSGSDPAVLIFNLQTNNIATGNGAGNVSDASAVSPKPADDAEIAIFEEQVNTPGSGMILQNYSYTDPDGIVTFFRYFILSSGIKDFTDDEFAAKPEFFRVETLHPITPDQWHHLLLSFDLSSPIVTQGPPTDVVAGPQWWNNVSEGTSSFAKMWYAIDDVDYRGRTAEPDEDGNPQYNMGPYSVDHDTARGESPGPRGGDPNGILTQAGWSVAYNSSPSITFGNQPYPRPEYSLTHVTLPAKDAELGLPASAKYAEQIVRVELAEFQMFTGVTLDTGVMANRRAFIDYKRDAKGAPIPDKNGDLTLVPVPPAKAAKLIGRIPDVELHKSGNWIKGNNTGSTGEGQDGKPISAGQFKPTGVIKKYKPDPSIAVT